MKIINQYQADDGRKFDSELDCMRHDALLRNIATVMRHLPSPPSDSSFCNGHGFIQHDPANVELVKNALIDMWVGNEDIKLGARAHPARNSILGRFFDDSGSPLQKPWHRLCCIDDQSREWGQMFFAINPDQGEQVRLNP